MVNAPHDVMQVTEWLAQLKVDLAQTREAVRLRGALPVPVGITESGTMNPTHSPGRLCGFALTNESADESATVRILFRDGKNADADVIMTVTLAPGESIRDWFGEGIALTHGLFLDADDDISGSVFLGAGAQ